MFYKYVECYYLENVLLFFDYFLIYCRNIYIINCFRLFGQTIRVSLVYIKHKITTVERKTTLHSTLNDNNNNK